MAVDGEIVYVGGEFIYGMAGMANDTYLRIVKWDGDGWLPMGAGLDGNVRTIAVVGSDVYVGGEFTVAGGTEAASRLTRWDGAAWHGVAGGVSDPDRSYCTTVRALASDGTTLYVGGVFTRVGALPVHSLAALDLASGVWSEPGGGVSSSWSSEPAEVRALTLRGSELFVGGSFDRAVETASTSFVSLDTVQGTWTAYGTGVTDEGMQGFVNTIAVDPANSDVYVGGRFTHAADVLSWNLALLRDGTFASLGNVSSYGGRFAEVLAVAVTGTGLYIGGSFTAVGNAAANHVAQYDGEAWSRLGEGVDKVVKALAPAQCGAVMVIWDFIYSGTLRVVRGGTWTGTSWQTFGQGVNADTLGNGTVSAIVPTGDGAFVGGLFDQAGQLPVGSVARWTGSEWDQMAGGLTATYGHGQVFAMQQIGADLYVAGSFQSAGGVVANNIAKWDGTAWSPLGDGLDDAAYAMAVLGGRLYAGGTFNRAGPVAAGHLACWDPAASAWVAVGNSPTYDDPVKALAVIGDRWLVIGGTFQRFFHGGTTIVEGLWGMTLFDTAAPLQPDDVLSGYHALEGTSRYGAPGWVHALQVVGGDLYVGGWFDVAGIVALGDRPSQGFPAANMAVWHFAESGAWESCGGADHQVQALAAFGESVAAAGWFAHLGGAAAARVGIYDPSARTWHALGSGLGDGERGASWGLALAQSDATGLWVGGQFPCAGGAPSDNLALWVGTAG